MHKITRLSLIPCVAILALAISACGDKTTKPKTKAPESNIASSNQEASKRVDAVENALYLYYGVHKSFPSQVSQVVSEGKKQGLHFKEVAKVDSQRYVKASGPNNTDKTVYIYRLTPQQAVVCGASQGDTNYCRASYGIAPKNGGVKPKDGYSLASSWWNIKGPDNAILPTVKLEFNDMGFKAPAGWEQ